MFNFVRNIMLIAYFCNSSYFPVLRNLANPRNAGVAEGGVGVEAVCDGFGDDGLTIGFKVGYHLLLNRYQLINLPTFLVKIRRNCLLLR